MDQNQVQQVDFSNDSSPKETQISLNQKWELTSFLFKSPNVVLAGLFFGANVFFGCMFLFYLADSIFSICHYSYGSMSSAAVSCPAIFFWYELGASFLGNIIWLLFLSIFLAFIPEGVIIALYLLAFKSLKKKNEIVLASGSSEMQKELKVIKILKQSLVAFPFVVVVMALLVYLRLMIFAV
jgi:hypothetical protein